MQIQGFNIAAVERDTGLSKDLLRMWERRYGFPAPIRDQYGERVYSPAEVERLRLVKRLIDKGFRPGKVLPLTPPQLEEMLLNSSPAAALEATMDWAPYLDMLRRGELLGLRETLQQQLVRRGLQGFVQDIAAPLTVAVGEAWMRGNLCVHEEHAYSEILTTLLRQTMTVFSERGRPLVLLTTLPDEEHGLGLLMAEALLMVEGAHCISLGIRTPLLEIVDAAKRHGADCVALSFSAAFPARQANPQLRELRQYLPPSIELWVGGAGSEHLTLAQGIFAGGRERGAAELVSRWHERHLQ